MASTINGNNGHNTLFGTSASERLNGFGGSDKLYGFGGDDTLDGGTGHDLHLVGSKGNDVYIVDSAGDNPVEFSGGGIDTVLSSISWSLANDRQHHIEHLTLTGTAANGTGNDLDNKITGNGAKNKLSGGDGDDILDGAGGNDSLSGGDDDDLMKGGAGGDAMVGGSGDDTYEVDSAADVTTESFNRGTDTVRSSATSHQLANHIERLEIVGEGLHGTGNSLANKMTGSSAGNVLKGADGNDNLSGLTGNDTLDGGGDNDVLLGGAGDDSLNGGSGNDNLIGGDGSDALLGGTGDDLLYWDSADSKVDGGGNTDTLKLGGGDSLDLVGLAGDEVKSIEVLDLRASGDDEVTLDGDAVAAINGGNTLTIKGSDGDRVVATDAWEFLQTASGYDVYGQGELRLRIQSGVEFESAGGEEENEDPVIFAGGAEGAVTEDTDVAAGSMGFYLVDSGQIAFGDDQTDGHSAEATPVSNTLGGTLGLDVTSPSVESNGRIDWTYTVDNAAVQHLGEGETASEVFTIQLSDGNGGQAEQTVIVTVTGVNDAAAIDGDAIGEVTEAGVAAGDNQDTGTLTVSDVDGADTFAAQTDSLGVYGDFSLTTAGVWTYDLNDADADTSALTAGQQVTDSFTVASADGTTSTVTITVTGANDAASLGGDAIGNVTEDGDVQDTGTLTVSDVDAGEAEVQAQTDTAGSYGSFSVTTAGVWTYDLDDALSDALAAGEQVTDSFTVTSEDGTDTTTVTITIAGANDAPAGADNTVAVPDNGTSAVYTFSASDFGFSDVDGHVLESVLISTLPASGVLSLDGTPVTAGQEIAVASVGQLTFTQAVGASAGSASFTFQVRDDGGTVDLDAAPNTMTVTLLDGDFVGSASANAYAATDAGGELVRGLGGADTLTGGTGADTIDVGAGDGAVDTVVFVTHPPEITSSDFIRGFLAGNDLVRFEGEAAAAIDEGVDNVIDFVTNGTGVDFSSEAIEAMLITGVPALDDADLVASGFTDLVTHLDAVLADTSEFEDGLLVVQGSSDTAVYYYMEDGEAGVVAENLTLLAVIDNALLGTANFSTFFVEE